jgi:hypothetical protein
LLTPPFVSVKEREAFSLFPCKPADNRRYYAAMPKRSGKDRHEARSGSFDPTKRPRKKLPEKADRSTDAFRGRKERSSEHFAPSGRTRNLPEKADQSHGDFRGHREEKSFSSFDRPKRQFGFASDDKRPSPQEQQKTVSAAALKRGLARAKDEIVGMCDEISALMTSRYNIGKVELTVSFNAAGEFIGFGSGGAASITITIIPSK